MPRKKRAAAPDPQPAERRRRGAGSYHYIKEKGLHRWRIKKRGEEYTITDQDPHRAEDRFRALVAQLEAGIDVRAGRQTLAQYLPAYLESLRGTLKQSSLEVHGRTAGYHILPDLGDYALADLSRPMIKAWVTRQVAYRREDGTAWALHGIRVARSLLSRCLDHAVEDGLITHNPAAGVKVPTRRPGDERVIADEADEEGKRVLTPEQVETLLAEVKRCDRHQSKGRAAQAHGMYALYVLALRTGMRRGELIGLRWRDIDLEGGWLHIRQQVVDLAEGLVITTPKTPAARRSIPLPPSLVTLLRNEKLFTGRHELVFCHPDGAIRSPNSVSGHARDVFKRLGWPGLHFHDLRKTAITNMRRARVDAEVVAQLAGHSDPRITLTTYAAATEERLRAAMGE